MESKMRTKTIPLLLIIFNICNCHAFAEMKKVDVGVIVDMSSMKGKIIRKSISMSISDFYKIHGSYKTRLVLHTRDSMAEPFTAFSADLLQNTQVSAIIGAQTPLEAKLLGELGNKDKVPILSFSPSYTNYPYLLHVTGLSRFTQRLRRKVQSGHESNMEINEKNEVGFIAYEVAQCLAKAAEKLHLEIFPNRNVNATMFAKHGSLFLKKILSLHSNVAQELAKRRFGHLLDNRRLLSSSNATTTKSATRSRKRLRIGVPIKSRFPELLNVQYDFQTNKTNASGFCVDVFKAAIEILPYKVNYEFIAFLTYPKLGRYDELVNQVYLKKYDTVIGDITITANRSLYVDFTLPFTDLGVGTVGLKQKGKSKWFFLKPLALDLWLASAGLFLFTGLVVWIIERRKNNEFQGSPSQQIGTAFWFSFSTLVFAHREKLLSNLSRFVMMVWVFVVLVLTSSYTATLTSMLTVQQIELNSRNNYIGYGSNIATESIINNFQNPRLQRLRSAEEFAEALSRGREHGGVSAIMDEMPYIKLFLAKFRKDYSMIGPVLPTSNGFGFAFSKNSKMVHDMSRAIVKLREEGRLLKMENTMLNAQTVATFGDTTNNVDPLDLETFQGLFLASGLSSVLALAIFSIVVLRSKWHVVVKHYDHFIGQRFKSFKRYIFNNLFSRIVR